jgi:hypothetical protein
MPQGAASDYVSRKSPQMPERRAIFTKQRELEGELAEIDREFQTVSANEAIKSRNASVSDCHLPPTGAPRQARRGSQREGLLNVIRQGNGLIRGEILKAIKSDEMSGCQTR